MDDFTMKTLGGRIAVTGFYETTDVERPTFGVGLVLDSLDWSIVHEFSTAAIVPGLIIVALALATIWGFRKKAWWAFPGPFSPRGPAPWW